MKKILLAISLSLLALPILAQGGAFTLSGTVPSVEKLNKKKIYLQVLTADMRDFVTTDSAVIANNAFLFKGKAAARPHLVFVSLAAKPDPKKQVRRVSFIPQAGKISLTFDSIFRVQGTPMNDAYQSFMDSMRASSAKMEEIVTASRKEENKDNEEFQKQLEANYDEQEMLKTSLAWDYAQVNIKNGVGEFIMLSHSYLFSTEQLGILLSQVDDSFKKTKNGQRLVSQYEALHNTTIGSKFTDIKGDSPDGTQIALSDYAGKGKVVLLDFWASWCGPCRKEMPNVVAAYGKYKDRGFEIVGVSLDTDKAAWKKALVDMKMTWPQMSDLKGWDSALGAPYAVKSIPFVLLLDSKGNIIKKNLRGSELEETLESLLGHETEGDEMIGTQLLQ